MDTCANCLMRNAPSRGHRPHCITPSYVPRLYKYKLTYRHNSRVLLCDHLWPIRNTVTICIAIQTIELQTKLRQSLSRQPLHDSGNLQSPSGGDIVIVSGGFQWVSHVAPSTTRDAGSIAG